MKKYSVLAVSAILAAFGYFGSRELYVKYIVAPEESTDIKAYGPQLARQLANVVQYIEDEKYLTKVKHGDGSVSWMQRNGFPISVDPPDIKGRDIKKIVERIKKKIARPPKDGLIVFSEIPRNKVTFLYLTATQRCRLILDMATAYADQHGSEFNETAQKDIPWKDFEKMEKAFKASDEKYEKHRGIITVVSVFSAFATGLLSLFIGVTVWPKWE